MQKMPQENSKLGNERKENDLRCSHLWEAKSENHRRCQKCGLNQLLKSIQQKCDIMQNWRLALRMCDEQQFILRNVIIWHKPNVMPSSVKDRFTVDYEPIFMFSREKRYYFEPQYETPHDLKRLQNRLVATDTYKKRPYGNPNAPAINPKTAEASRLRILTLGRNKRSVWKIPTHPFSKAHFATFPPALIETPIKAGCPEFICRSCGKAREKIIEVKVNSYRFDRGKKSDSFGVKQDVDYERIERGYTDCGCPEPKEYESGIVLDPFVGSGTTAVVAKQLGRNYIGIDISPDYCKMAKDRINRESPNTLWQKDIAKVL